MITKSVTISLKIEKDKTEDGITILETKKLKRNPSGSVTFHIDDRGIVVKIEEKNIYK